MLGPYQLVRRIGVGGMAEVWVARHQGIAGFQREVVIKRILPHLAGEPRFVQMLFNEARVAARFNHPNIAQIYDFGADGGTHYIAMEYVRGMDLTTLMSRAQAAGIRLPHGLALRVIADCCKGLGYAHEGPDGSGGVVHRDVSPSNILISMDGSVKLVDFGIAKAAGQLPLTRPGTLKGKLSYMSPEQASGLELDHRSDIFSLGLVLYELLTGVRPLQRENEVATLSAAAAGDIPPPSAIIHLPPDLDEVVMRALKRDREARYRTAREFQMALERLLVGKQCVITSIHLSELMERLTNPAEVAPALDRQPESLPSGAGLVTVVEEPDTEVTSAPPPPPRRSSRITRPAPGSVRAPMPPPAPEKSRRLPLLAGGGAVLWLALLLLGATRTSASPLGGVADVPIVRFETSAIPGAESGKGPGQLAITTFPQTEVYLRDRRIGTTPFWEVHLPPGQHQLRLVNENAGIDHRVLIEIRPARRSELRLTW